MISAKIHPLKAVVLEEHHCEILEIPAIYDTSVTFIQNFKLICNAFSKKKKKKRFI
jgi:hypothetical protein